MHGSQASHQWNKRTPRSLSLSLSRSFTIAFTETRSDGHELEGREVKPPAKGEAVAAAGEVFAPDEPAVRLVERVEPHHVCLVLWQT